VAALPAAKLKKALLGHKEAVNSVAYSPDGRYSLVISGQTVATFFRLFGDVNGDGKVDATDQTAFMAAYRSRSGMANYRGYFDYDGNGMVDSSDYYQFLVHLNHKLDANGNLVPI
jgi:hypothetical protein